MFDEVDSGIGGATAAAVGERLKRLAKDVQVLVVTHSPQVAAVADRHWLIRKTTTRNAASTDVLALDAKGRREEIARMLSGAEVTAEARAAADRLLAAGLGGADVACRQGRRRPVGRRADRAPGARPSTSVSARRSPITTSSITSRIRPRSPTPTTTSCASA